jgi:uncharacterized protein (TIGR03437 family)
MTAIGWAQPPAIDQEGVFNAASHIPPALPGAGLAPGSRAIIKGLRFEASSHVRIDTRELKVLATSATSLEILLPAELASGAHQITVSNQDGVSRPFTVRAVPAAVGLYSENQKSWGPAKMERPYVLTGTGLGAVRNPEILVAGKPARLLRAGPKPDTPGVDEIEFALPEGTPNGCHVPVLARIPGGPTSNTVSVPVAECRDATPDASTFLLLARMLSRIYTVEGRNIDFTQDMASAVFAPPPVIAKLLNPWRLRPPVGTCTSYTGPFWTSIDEAVIPGFFGDIVETDGVDAGPSVQLRGAHGSVAVTAHGPGLYHDVIGANKSLYRVEKPLFLTPGDYTFSWKSGAARVAMPAPFTWTNAGQIATIDRSAGVTVEWKSTEKLMAIVAANVDADTGSMGVSFCLASGSRFHMPAESLANVPPGARDSGVPLSLLILAPIPEFQKVDGAITLATTVRALAVTYR